MGIDDLALQLGKYKVDIQLEHPGIILIGGRNSNNPPEIIASSAQAIIDFEGEKIELPNHLITQVNFPFSHLNPAAITNGIAFYELMIYINGSTRASTHWKSADQWVQNGFMIPPYLGKEDLMEILYSTPISGKGLDFRINKAEQKIDLPEIKVPYPSDVPKEQIIDVDFPSRWNDSELTSSAKVTTVSGIYLITNRILRKNESQNLREIAQEAIAYQRTAGDITTLCRLEKQILPRVKLYASQYK